MTSNSLCQQVKVGELVLVQDVIYTYSGNRTTLIDSLQKITAINSIGKVFADDIEKIQTHETLRYTTIEGAEEKHKEKVQKMLTKHGLDYNTIHKIVTKDRGICFPQ